MLALAIGTLLAVLRARVRALSAGVRDGGAESPYDASCDGRTASRDERRRRRAARDRVRPRDRKAVGRGLRRAQGALYPARAGRDAARKESAPAGAPVEDAVEAAVLAYRARLRSCARCGPRPEPDAMYCSNCGAYLDEKCAGCGACRRGGGGGVLRGLRATIGRVGYFSSNATERASSNGPTWPAP